MGHRRCGPSAELPGSPEPRDSHCVALQVSAERALVEDYDALGRAVALTMVDARIIGRMIKDAVATNDKPLPLSITAAAFMLQQASSANAAVRACHQNPLDTVGAGEKNWPL
jgi:hypothetical protein